MHVRTRCQALTFAAGAALLFAGTAHATLVQTDFNQQSPGVLRGQTAFGTGLTGTWNSGSSVPDVGSGDLAAPVATGFNLAQGGTAQHVLFDNVERQNGADLTTSLSGAVWGTFLVNTTGGGAAGIGVNSVVSFSTFSGRPRLIVSDDDLMFFAANDDITTVENIVPDTGDSLILFRMVFPGDNGFTIEAWVNPVLTSPLPLPDLAGGTTVAEADIWTRLGVGGSIGTSPATIDFITLSDGPEAFTDATGQPFPGFVPEPASCMLLSVVSLVLLRPRS